MQADVRRKLEMAERVRSFSRANPFTDAVSSTVVARLEELLTRASVLATQESSGRQSRHAAKVRRDDLRHALTTQFLRPVVRAGDLIARQRPELLGKFRLPKSAASTKSFFMVAQDIHAAAVSEKAEFAGVGVSEAVLGDLGQAVQEFGEVNDAVHMGRSAHVGARAELKEVTGEAMGVIGVLDGLNRVRFRADPEKLAAWENERNIIGPFRIRSSETNGGNGSNGSTGSPVVQ